MIFARYRRFLWLVQIWPRGAQVNAGAVRTVGLAGDAIFPAKAYPLAVDVLP